MKKTLTFAFFLGQYGHCRAAGSPLLNSSSQCATRRGDWWGLTALAGVFVRRKLPCIIAAGMLLLCTACKTETDSYYDGYGYSYGEGGLAFRMLTNNTYEVSAGKVTGGTVVIPSTHKNIPVTQIGMMGFQGTAITSVTIPASVTHIRLMAFNNCNGLTSVTFAPGSNISSTGFGSSAFPGPNGDGDNYLMGAYLDGGAGTYTRAAVGGFWTKQP